MKTDASIQYLISNPSLKSLTRVGSKAILGPKQKINLETLEDMSKDEFVEYLQQKNPSPTPLMRSQKYMST